MKIKGYITNISSQWTPCRSVSSFFFSSIVYFSHRKSAWIKNKNLGLTPFRTLSSFWEATIFNFAGGASAPGAVRLELIFKYLLNFKSDFDLWKVPASCVLFFLERATTGMQVMSECPGTAQIEFLDHSCHQQSHVIAPSHGTAKLAN